jgi:hypothetical protein
MRLRYFALLILTQQTDKMLELTLRETLFSLKSLKASYCNTIVSDVSEVYVYSVPIVP